jgi:PAS domain-containing protein
MSDDTDQPGRNPPGIATANSSDTQAVSAANEQHFRALANALPIVVWTAAPDGSVTFVSDCWRKYTGIDFRSAAAGHTLHPDDREQTLARWRAAIRT